MYTKNILIRGCSKFKKLLNFNGQRFTEIRGIRKMSVIPEKMKAWEVTGSTVFNIELSTVRVPMIVQPTDVLVKVNAASVNPLDVAMLAGYGDDILNTLAFAESFFGVINQDVNSSKTVGRDFSGEVVAVGHSVKNVNVKDKVWGVTMPHHLGSHAEYVVTDHRNLCKKPECLSDVEAASIPFVGLTGWSAVVLTGGIDPRYSEHLEVLVLGASGGVGTFICQLLSAWNVKVTGVCSEDAFELALSCGVSEVYDYMNPETYTKLTSSPRFDLIIDASGGNNTQITLGLKKCMSGTYISLASPFVRNIDENGLSIGLLKSTMKLIEQNTVALPYGRFVKWAYFVPNPAALQEIGNLVTKKKIRPIIDKVFTLNEAEDAYKHVREGPKRGKTVLHISS